MNMRIFAESLNIHEINELSIVLWDAKKVYARRNLVPVNNDERLVTQHGYYIAAIKLYKARTGLGLLESKLAIDSIRDY